MKTFDDRKKNVESHIKKIKRKRRTAAICLTVAAAILALVLFVPYSTTPPDVSRYAGSEYYGIIQHINTLSYTAPKYKNNFQAMVGFLSEINLKGANGGVAMEGADNMAAAPGATFPGNSISGEGYVEVTDNQVSGVTESDILKRSENFAYYLRGNKLTVYTIAQEASQQVGSYSIQSWEGLSYVDNAEMYLSADCTTVTILAQCYHKELGALTQVLNLDVTDPSNITEIGSQYFTGSYVSSRMVDGALLLAYNYSFAISGVDFEKPETFVPQYGTLENMTCIPGSDILCPGDVTSYRYTVLCKLSGSTLEIQGTTALMSYSQELYVSADTIYATHSYNQIQREENSTSYRQRSMTEITGISYAGDGLEIVGTVAVEGSVKDQYSMDQYDGVLRVVTSTTEQYLEETIYGEYASLSTGSALRNVNLYCIDLDSWAVAAEVIAFAPEGEDAQSVRFDGVNAYVCTAEVITLTDPVYFFDLTDLEHISWTDTGTIDGYSTSLIQLKDGYLLGVGYGEGGGLKIEVYQEYQGEVISVCSYERMATFSEVYKSYLIDRENNLFGMAFRDWEADYDDVYVLLHFDGYQLHELVRIDGLQLHNWGWETIRAFLADDWLYVFTNGSFATQQIW